MLIQVLDAYIHPVLAFAVGAILASLGTTAGSRIVDLYAKERPNLSEESLLQLLVTLLQRLLAPSKCDRCKLGLPVWATLPIVGILGYRCRSAECTLAWPTRLRYLGIEIAGGTVGLALWGNKPPPTPDASPVADVFGLFLIPFLLSTVIALREQLYELLVPGERAKQDRQHLDLIDSRASIRARPVRQICDYILMIGIGLAVIGLSFPINETSQSVGVVFVGWAAWMIGLQHVSTRSSLSASSPQIKGTTIRCLTAGIVLGSWLGVYIGLAAGAGLLLLIGIGFMAYGKRAYRYSEELLLVILSLAFIVIFLLVQEGCFLNELMVLGVDYERIRSIIELCSRLLAEISLP